MNKTFGFISNISTSPIKGKINNKKKVDDINEPTLMYLKKMVFKKERCLMSITKYNATNAIIFSSRKCLLYTNKYTFSST